MHNPYALPGHAARRDVMGAAPQLQDQVSRRGLFTPSRSTTWGGKALSSLKAVSKKLPAKLPGMPKLPKVFGRKSNKYGKYGKHGRHGDYRYGKNMHFYRRSAGESVYMVPSI